MLPHAKDFVVGENNWEQEKAWKSKNIYVMQKGFYLKILLKIVKTPRNNWYCSNATNWINIPIEQVRNLRIWTYIDAWPKYFADQLDQICYFNWWVSDLNKPAKYVKQMRKCFFHNVINWCSLLIWFEPAKTINNQEISTCTRDISSHMHQLMQGMYRRKFFS